MRKEIAEKVAKEFLKGHYPRSSPDVQTIDLTPAPSEYCVSGRIDIGDLQPRWANFKVFVNTRAEEVIDYEVVRDRS